MLLTTTLRRLYEIHMPKHRHCGFRSLGRPSLSHVSISTSKEFYVFDCSIKLLTAQLVLYCLALLVVYEISKAITKQSTLFIAS